MKIPLSKEWVRAQPLFILAFLLGYPVAQAGQTTQIQVTAHLDDDGRLQVTETHQIKIGIESESDFRVFGLGPDQSIALKGITRISADGVETPLVNQEVEGPDQYRYYPRGHVYYRYPVVTVDTAFRYRFEYQLVNAVSPAWAIAAGWEPLTPEFGFGSPWKRWQALIADVREAWPAPARRYRLDHDVLFPDRPERNDAFQIDYDLVFDTAWREVQPDAKLARITPSVDCRVRRLFEYLPPGAPPAAAHREAATRIGAILAVLTLGPLFYLGMLLVEFLTSVGNRLDPNQIDERLAAFAPEEIQARLDDVAPQISLAGLLSRMASEKKLAIEVDQPRDDGRPAEVRLQLLVSRESLPSLERALVEEIFEDDGDITTSERVHHRSEESGRDLSRAVRGLLSKASHKEWTRMSRLAVPLLILGFWSGVGQVTSLPDDDLVIAVIVNALALAVVGILPKRWWHGGRVSRGLLLPLVLLAGLFFTLHFGINRPYPASLWQGSAICILAFYLAQLINSRLPMDTRGKTVRELVRIRRYAKAELRMQTPRIDDRWIPQLSALGLEADIERWRNESGQMLLTLSRDADDLSQRYSGAVFTGQLPKPFQSRPGWTDAFYGEPDEEDDFDNTEDQEELDAPGT